MSSLDESLFNNKFIIGAARAAHNGRHNANKNQINIRTLAIEVHVVAAASTTALHFSLLSLRSPGAAFCRMVNGEAFCNYSAPSIITQYVV